MSSINIIISMAFLFMLTMVRYGYLICSPTDMSYWTLCCYTCYLSHKTFFASMAAENCRYLHGCACAYSLHKNKMPEIILFQHSPTQTWLTIFSLVANVGQLVTVWQRNQLISQVEGVLSRLQHTIPVWLVFLFMAIARKSIPYLNECIKSFY